ncbi:MAG: hypothetical protein BWX88_00379 [Planctomycetes bacterium ADurb.Bin126]|nr:MAG: hypothetical protein BWX88_00379 [Planctomycetes bacterium ADurb.Bin126]HOD81275.1 hypothetical protein [Phycisphaerae bacterium]HQL71603.1 hypothetical protein [Phycisphaerae bacterium]
MRTNVIGLSAILVLAGGILAPLARAQDQPKLMQVTATGVAAQADKALQAAFGQAIEQVMGVLVDSETRVKNDQLVKDEILTFSRGFVQKYEVLKTWQEDGLHYARIVALVEIGQMWDKLRAKNVAVRPIPGELLYRQAQFDLSNEKDAAAMLRKALGEFDPARVMKVTISGKPEVLEKNDTHAKLSVQVQVSPDLEAWGRFQAGATPLLTKLATTRAAYMSRRRDLRPGQKKLRDLNSPHRYTLDPENLKDLEERLGEAKCVLHLMTGMNAEGTQLRLTAFALGEHLAPVLGDLAERRYRLRVALCGSDGTVIMEGDQPVNDNYRFQELRFPTAGKVGLWAKKRKNSFFVSPLCTHHSGTAMYYHALMRYEYQFTVPLDKLPQVTRCMGAIEPVVFSGTGKSKR